MPFDAPPEPQPPDDRPDRDELLAIVLADPEAMARGQWAPPS
jgi:hypothetical protein